MTRNLFKAPINEFFERVPIGRILNRYSEDMTIADNQLPQIMEVFSVILMFVFSVLLVLISVSRTWLLPIVAVYITCYFILAQLHRSSNRKLILIERNTKSKALSYFSEILLGLPIIRTFK